jgi:tripartite ATP-independent transporter DctP family solute receptor
VAAAQARLLIFVFLSVRLFKPKGDFMQPRRTLLGVALATLITAALIACGKKEEPAPVPAPVATPAQTDYKPEYKMSLVLGPPTPWGMAGQIWADLVKERTAGRINIKLFPGVSLVQGDQTREFSALRQGVIDMAVGSTINWSPQIKELNLFSMPFLMPDYAAVDALTQGEVGKQIFATVEQAGAVPLAWGENGYRELTNSKKPIKSPEDLKGMKFRVVGSPIYADMFSAMGANPTQMSWADAQPALSSGAVDGQENPLFLFTVLKMHTVGQKFVTTWGYVADPLIFVVNKEVFASWTPADQAIVRQAAIDAGKQEIALARKGLTEADKPLLKEIAAMGVTVTQLTPAEREVFVKATRPVYDKWKNTVGVDLVTSAEKAIAARKK